MVGASQFPEDGGHLLARICLSSRRVYDFIRETTHRRSASKSSVRAKQSIPRPLSRDRFGRFRKKGTFFKKTGRFRLEQIAAIACILAPVRGVRTSASAVIYWQRTFRWTFLAGALTFRISIPWSAR